MDTAEHTTATVLALAPLCQKGGSQICDLSLVMTQISNTFPKSIIPITNTLTSLLLLL